MAAESIRLGRINAPGLALAALSFALLSVAGLAGPLSQSGGTMVSPFWTTEQGYDTILMVNNPVDSPQSFRLRLFSDSGEVLLEQELRLEGVAGGAFSLGKLLGGTGSGHLQLDFGSDIQRLAAASLIQRGDTKWTVDLVDQRRIPEARTLRSLAPSLDAGQETVIALHNPGSQAVAGLIRVTGSAEQEVSWRLAPGQSRRLRFRHGPGQGGLAFEVEQLAAADRGLLVAGFSHSPSSGSFALHFDAGDEEAELLAGFFTGERPLLGLWNASEQVASLSFEALLTSGATRSGELSLEAGAVEKYDLSRELGLNDGEEGVLLVAPPSGQTVVGRLLDARSGGQTVVASPLRNPALEDPAHGVPVQLGERSNTRFLLYNPNPEPMRFNLMLYFGAERYTYPQDLLQPFELSEIDLGRSRSEWLAGQTGGFIPEGEVSGQGKIFQLSALPGRLMMMALVEEQRGDSLSFHCPICPPTPEEMFFNPGSVSGLTGQTVNLPPAILEYSDGSSADVTADTDVTITDTSIATLATGHKANLLAVGSTSGVGSYTSELVEGSGECLLIVVVVAAVLILVQDPPVCEITGPADILVGEDSVALATSIQPAGSATSWRNVTSNNVCLPLQPEGKISARAPDQKTIQMTCNYSDGTSQNSNQFAVSGKATTQYVRVTYSASANSILNATFSNPDDVTDIRNRVSANLANLFSMAKVVFANQPAGGVTKITTLDIRGNSPGTQGGEASFDLMNLTRVDMGVVYLGTGSLDLANSNDPVPSTQTINERRNKNRVADAISRLAAHEIGHMLGLVPRSSELSGGFGGAIAAKQMVNGLGLNGTSTHHNPTSNDINIMQAVANLGVDRTWNATLYSFEGRERTYLQRILP